MRNVFIIGSKGIPAKYGGFETFVENLTKKQKNKDIKYHVACFSDKNSEFEYNGARCFNINVPNIGSGRAVIYDILALREAIKYIKEKKIEDAIVYILACRIGPFIKYYKKILDELGATLIINPDGHEWRRAKWNNVIKKYWKISEEGMIKNADLVICDSVNIEKYIKEEYGKYNPTTTFIAYGADIQPKYENDDDSDLTKWYEEKSVKKNEYYLIVGRFVPENNYETVIKEFMKSNSKKDLVVITNVEKNKFYDDLEKTTNFNNDKRIKFVGTVYNSKLLRKIRENAYGYFHGHEVGGTNPSLLEALATTKVNIVLSVGFNREVVKTGGLYFTKDEGNLAKIIDKLEMAPDKFRDECGERAKSRIRDYYNWDNIVSEYEKLLIKCSKNNAYIKNDEMISNTSF